MAQVGRDGEARTAVDRAVQPTPVARREVPAPPAFELAAGTPTERVPLIALCYGRR